MNNINLWLHEATSDAELFLNEYLRQEYFLGVLGSIFLFGIVARLMTMSVYDRLIRKSENMMSTKNKTLKQIKTKYENSKAVNGSMANPSLMVERYINKYKFMGISLRKLSGITEKCCLLCLGIGGLAGLYSYNINRLCFRALIYVAAGAMAAYWLDLFSRSTGLGEKHNEIVCIITDFLENTMDIRDKRVERAGKLAEQLDIQIEEEEDGRLTYNPEPDVVHTDIEEWEKEVQQKNRIQRSQAENMVRRQEYIISEVLGEFF